MSGKHKTKAQLVKELTKTALIYGKVETKARDKDRPPLTDKEWNKLDKAIYRMQDLAVELYKRSL